jgi:DnaJ-like protein
MSFSRVVENRIREAIAEGKFDNLPGSGQPLDLEEYFSTPEDLRMAYSILKNARIAPAEVELLKEIARVRHTLEQTNDEDERRSLQQTLADRQTELAVRLERRSRQPR